MRIQINNREKKVAEEKLDNASQAVGLVKVEQTEKGNEFTIRVLDVNHIGYSYDPVSKKFEVRFLSLLEDRQGGGKKGGEG